MVGARSLVSLAAASKACCSTKSFWCLEALARASQTGGRSFASVTCTKFSRCAKLAPKYSAAPLCSFFSRTRLFSSRVSQSSTATSLNVLAVRVPAAWLMLGSSSGRWLSSRRWRYWSRSLSGRGAEGSGTTSTE